MKNMILPLAAALVALGATTVATANPPAPKPDTHCDDKGDHHGGHATECPHHEDGKGH
ncbi:MAG: hypothetical protein V4579_10270 [Pseudomonadota bacterium]